jgi:hypothetical protein
MTRTVVTLTRWDEELAFYAAMQRTMKNVLDNVAEAHGADTPWGGFDWNLMAILGEIGCARYFNLTWTGGWGAYNLIDVGERLEVRSRQAPHHHVLLHKKDPDHMPVVSVIVVREQLPRVLVSGWMMIKDGKQEKYWGDKARNNRPCYWVPPDLLRPIEELEI